MSYGPKTTVRQDETPSDDQTLRAEPDLDHLTTPFLLCAAAGFALGAGAWTVVGLDWFTSTWRLPGTDGRMSAGTIFGGVAILGVVSAAFIAKTQLKFLAACAVAFLSAGGLAIFTAKSDGFAADYELEWILAVSVSALLLLPVLVALLRVYSRLRETDHAAAALASRWDAAGKQGACVVRVERKDGDNLKLDVLWQGGQTTKAVCESGSPRVGESFVLFDPKVSVEADTSDAGEYRTCASVARLQFTSAIPHPFNAPPKPSRMLQRFVIGTGVLTLILSFAMAFLIASNIRSQEAATVWIVEVSTGQGPAAKPGDTVQVHYMISLPEGEVIDRSKGPSTESLELSPRVVVPGFVEGLTGMRVGGKRNFIVPPELAYGDKEVADIPPNSPLLFEVQLVGIR